jgi:drug/metabolite transporter (DMT)-like permease
MQLFGMALALAGALVVVSGGNVRALTHDPAASGDALVLLGMLGWSGYTLLQLRAAPGGSLLARVSLFAAAGALLSLPPAMVEMWRAPARVFSVKAAEAYLFAGFVPGLIAYAGFAWLAATFGSVRTSLVMYVGPIAGALLSYLILGEPPTWIQAFGGALILGGVWASLRK